MTDWTNPRTWTIGELVTKALLDVEVRDHLNALWVGTTAGDLEYYINATRKGRIGIGTNGQILQVIAGVPTWVSGERYQSIYLNADIALTTGDFKGWFMIPPALNGWNVTHVSAMRSSGTGVPALQLRNATTGSDILSTKVTIDSGETTSSTAATPPVINTANDGVSAYDILSVDVDVSGTNTFCCMFMVGFTKP